MQRLLGGLAVLGLAVLLIAIARQDRGVAAQDATTGLVAPLYFGTGAPTKTCSATNLAGVAYVQTDATNGRLWICDNTSGSMAWDHQLSPILGATASFGGSLILLGSNVTSTATATGAVVGNNCVATRADGTFLGVGMAIDCAILAANVATVRISAIIAGTPPAGIYNVRVIQ
jgi:hypothetical protein